MNIEDNQKKDFLTIVKTEYNHNLGRNIDKTFRYYEIKDKAFKMVGPFRRRDKENDTYYFPPTLQYTFYKPEESIIDPVKKTLDLVVKQPTEEQKITYAEDIQVQDEILRIVKKRRYRYNYNCGLIKTNTGGGKSHVIMNITEFYQTNTLILCHNVKTVGEMYQKFVKFTNITPARYGGGKKELSNVTIMTKKSFALDYEKIKQDFGLVLIDEAPIYFSKAFWNGLNRFFDGKEGIALYGLSATPYTLELNESDLNKYFGKTIEVKKKDRNGYNFIPSFIMYDYIVDKWVYEYRNPAEMRTQVADNTDRFLEQEKHIKELFQSRKCLLILTDRVSEADRFYKCSGLGWCFLITGNTKVEQDDRNIEAAEKLVKAGKRVTIIGTIQKVKAGVDIPMIDTVFIASAIKFGGNVIQAIGRGLRMYKDKTSVSVGVWNDYPHYKKQKTEKKKVILSEYQVKEDDIKLVRIMKRAKKNINKK